MKNRTATCFSIGLAAIAFLVAFPVERVVAQNPSGKPTYGSVKLKAGFPNDPFVKKLTAGGSIKTKLGGVNAHVAKVPDFVLFYTKGNFPLTISAKSKADTTLLINLPNGKWVANDDGGAGRNPLLRFAKPLSGRYDIFVGTFGPKLAPAELIITELKVKRCFAKWTAGSATWSNQLPAAA